jgi:branched-chain amino acid transport system substrate-binding protein
MEQTYETSDPTVDSQVVNLKATGANVFFNVSIAKFSAQAIRKAHDIGWKPLHLLNSVSTSVAAVLKPAGLDASKGIVSTFYVKDPTDPQWKNSQDYKDWLAWMRRYYPEGSLEDSFNAYAYGVGSTMVQVLKQCGNDVSRENIMRQAANLKDLQVPMLLPGVKVNTSPTDHAPIEQEQLARFDGERWVLFGEIFDASKK